MNSSIHLWLLIVTGMALIGAVAGLSLSDSKRPRGTVPFSGGLLIGIALFWVLPELSGHFPAAWAALLVLIGFAALWLIDRYIYPVCPSCSHTHDHQHCSARLHGFGGPFILAAVVHSFLDGWSVAASQSDPSISIGAAFLFGALAHKLPEGLAYAAILRASFATRNRAIFWVVAIQATTLIGGWTAMAALPFMSSTLLHTMLAFAAGSFVYLGYHAIHNDWVRRGRPAVAPAIGGAAGAAVIEQSVRLFLR